MGKVNNPGIQSLDSYSKNEWVDFLKQGAYRGLKINKIARHLEKAQSCEYNKSTHKLNLISEKGKIIPLDMAKLLRKNERWTFSRLIHNIKMCFSSSDYVANFDVRIQRLASLVSKKTTNDFSHELEKFVASDQDLSDLKRFFHRNLELINQSTGNKELQTNLLKLSEKAFEKADNAESRIFAFQVQCTANAMIPDSNLSWASLPPDIQKLLFTEADKNEDSANPLNMVSKELNENIHGVEKDWIHESLIRSRTEGCQTAKEAVGYIMDHGLSSANLLSFPDLNDTDLDELIENCPYIKNLSISSEFVSSTKLLELISSFTSLKSLDLTLSNIVTGECLIKIAKRNPSLKHLKIYNRYDTPNLTVDQLLEIAKTCPNLTSLSINVRNLSGEQALKIAKSLPNLRKFKMEGSQVDEFHLLKIVETLKDLQELDFNGCPTIGGRQVIEIIKLVPDLRYLDVSFCKNILDDQLLEIAKMRPNLVGLNVSDCDFGSKIIEIVQELPKLRILKLNSCAHISGDDVVEIAKHSPELIYLEAFFNKIPQDKLADAISYLPNFRLSPDALILEDFFS